MAPRLRAVVVADGPNTTEADALTDRAKFGSDRLYIVDHTRWLPYGPHRFDPSADITSATSSGGLSAIQTCRAAWRAAVASPAGAGIFLPMGLEPNGYLNGYSDGAGGWTDTSHPSRYEDDGGPLWARQTAHALLQGAGLADWQVPEFDRCAWQADGSYAEVWCSAGPVTTLRAARGEAALADDFAHWTEVMGFEISGQPAQRAELVSGRVRIYPNAGAFTPLDVLSFGAGGASGMLEVPEDYIAGIYRNYPILDLGAARVGGLPLRPVNGTAYRAVALSDPSPSFAPEAAPVAGASFQIAGGDAASGAGPFFWLPSGETMGPNNGQITFAFEGAIASGQGASRWLFAIGGSGVSLLLNLNRSLRLSVRDSANTSVGAQTDTTTGLVTLDAGLSLVLSVDLVAGYARTWHNGAPAHDIALTAGTGMWGESAFIGTLSQSPTGSGIPAATVERLRVWRAATPDGTLPATAPVCDVTGPASAANAHAWKRGADAV